MFSWVEETDADANATRSCGGVILGKDSRTAARLCGRVLGTTSWQCHAGSEGMPDPLTTGTRMTQKTVTRADLAEAVYGSVGLSRTESAELVERVLELISDALVTGANVKLSSFGSFQVRSKNERIGRNPKTGEEVPILPRQVLVFKPSNVLKSKINKSMVGAGK